MGCFHLLDILTLSMLDFNRTGENAVKNNKSIKNRIYTDFNFTAANCADCVSG
jgi:hypothetical protein